MAKQMQLDVAVCQEMEKMVEKLTTSGQGQLLPEPLKQLKKICKKSDDYVKKCFYLVMTQLEKDHSEIRLSSVQLVNELFIRSHCFRDLLLVDFQYFMELTTEIDGELPLPPPKQAAKMLKSTTIEMIHQWHEKFGDTYKKLALGYNFLKNCKKINFQDIHARSVADQRREEERISKAESQKADRLKKTVEEMTDFTVEIMTCLTQAQNCLALLLPRPEDFQIPGLQSPDIFHTKNPWKRQSSDLSPNTPQRHVNKSTKGKQGSPSTLRQDSDTSSNGNGIKIEPSDTHTVDEQSSKHSSNTQQRHVNKSTKGKGLSQATLRQDSDGKTVKIEPSIITSTVNQQPSDQSSGTPQGHDNKSISSKSTSKQTSIASSDYGDVGTESLESEIRTTVDLQDQVTGLTTCSVDGEDKIIVKSENILDGVEESHTGTIQVHSKTEDNIKPSSMELKVLGQASVTKSNDSISTSIAELPISGRHPVQIKIEPEYIHANSNRCDKPDSKNSEDSNQSEEFQEISSDSEQSEEEEEYEEEDFVRGHGLGSQLYSIDINIGSDLQVQETSDNQDILLTLKDLLRLINGKFLPSIQKWLEVFAKNGAEQERVKRALDLRSALEKMREKIGKLKIIKATKQVTDNGKPASTKQEADDDDDSEDDFEEVTEKEGYEPHIPEELREEYGLIPKPPKPSTNPDWVLPQIMTRDEEDPASFMSTIKKMKEKMKSNNLDRSESKVGGPSTSCASSAKKPKHENVPVLPFGSDLYHWGEDMETPLMVRYDSEHRFWIPKDDGDTVDVNALESMTSRVMNFVGKFEPVKWACKAPLPNGTLCPRMDRYKCPFHGKIVSRDAVGQPTNQEDVLRIKQEEELKREQQPAEWDDAELQAEIRAATGIDLERKGKGRGKTKGKKGKGHQPKYPGLTNVKKMHNTSRNRLEKKVFNRNALGRVADALDRIDDKKRKDKFGNSFHYVHGPRKTT